MDKYDAKIDIHSQRDFTKDWNKIFPATNEKNGVAELHYLDSTYIRVDREDQIREGIGYTKPGFWLSFAFFTYLGGLYHARRTFIPGLDYFFNHKFDFVGGRKPIFLGMLLGVGFGAKFFGNNLLLGEEIKTRKWRAQSTNRILKDQDYGTFKQRRRLTYPSMYDDLGTNKK